MGFIFFFPFLSLAQEQNTCPLDGRCDQEGIYLTNLFQSHQFSLPLIAFAGLIDSINPCAIGMLILLLGYLLVFAKKPERMKKIGGVYILTIFITYFVLGFIFSQLIYPLIAWPYYKTVGKILKYLIVGLIWLIALINLKDFFWFGKGFTLGISPKRVPLLMKYIEKASLPATIILGILVTLFELPCSLPLYVGAIVYMTSIFSFFKTVFYLLIYNIIFVLPLIVIFLILLKTKKIFEAKDFQERANRYMKLSMALAQIAIGIILLLI